MYLIHQKKISAYQTSLNMEGWCFQSNCHFHYLQVIIIIKLMFWKHRGSVWKSAVRYVSVNFTSFLRGNSRKPPVRFLEVYNTRKQGGILGLTFSRFGNSWKPLLRFPPSFQFRESRWNPAVDCFQVWKPSGNHIEGFPEMETTGKLLMSRFLARGF